VSRKLWKYYLTAGSAALLLYFVGIPARWAGLLFTGFGMISLIMLLIGLRLYRPYPSMAWILIFCGQFFYFLGDFIYTSGHVLFTPDLSMLISSVAYFLGVVLWQVALVVLFIRFRKLIGREALIHGLIIITAIVTIIWMIYFGQNPDWLVGFENAMSSLSYLGIGVLASIFLMSRIGQNYSYRFLFVSLLANIPGMYFFYILMSDPARVVFIANIPVVVLYDLSYSVEYLLLGLAFLHPSIQNFRSSLPEKSTIITKVDILIFGGAFWAIVLTFLYQYFNHQSSSILVAMIGMAIIFCLVVLRLAQIVKVLEVQNHLLVRQQVQLNYQANYDTLTNLPNRNYLYSFLEDAVQRLRPGAGCNAVFMIDLNFFKQVNDTFGHDQGDLVLQHISDEMMRLKRKGDLVARWGGDEFVFILGGVENYQDALAFARRLTQEVQANVTREEQSVLVTLSIGIHIFLPGDEAIDAILKKADIALYRAKSQLTEKIAFYQDPEASE
jgi:diguanylate cyclase (GGDEF)-like protein